MQRAWLVVAVLLGCEFTSVARAEEAPAARDSLLLADGTLLRGVVESRDDATVVLLLDGGERRQYGAGEVRRINYSATNPLRPRPPPAPALPTQRAPEARSLESRRLGAAPPDTAPAPAPTSYGYQFIAADVVSLALLWDGRTGGHTPGAAVGAAIFLVNGPLVHGLHGRGWRAVGSLSLRLLLPVAGVAAGSVASGGDKFWSSGQLAGAAVGFLLPALLDCAVLGEPGDRPASAALPSAQVGVAATRSGLALVGLF